MDTEAAIVAALEAQPQEPKFTWRLAEKIGAGRKGGLDASLRVVWADLLLERGDPRGEQLVLEHRVEVAPGPGWHAEARALLQLTAERGFVRVPEDPDAALLDWRGHVRPEWWFTTTHQGRRHEATYDEWARALIVDGRHIALPVRFRTLGETNYLLHLVSDAVRADAVDALAIPGPFERERDPRYRTGPYPRYEVPVEFGDHTLQARDLQRWYAIYHRWK